MKHHLSDNFPVSNLSLRVGISLSTPRIEFLLLTISGYMNCRNKKYLVNLLPSKRRRFYVVCRKTHKKVYMMNQPFLKSASRTLKVPRSENFNVIP